jgi:HAD superfamily hydrolase (TIGR01509 family)
MPERTVTEVSAYMERVYYKYAMKYLVVNPDACLFLKTLASRKIKLGCVTNSHRKMTRKILEKTGLIRYFDLVITADDVSNPKPAPDMLLEACRILKVHPSSVVFVGDTEYDALAGKAAGCMTVMYRICDAKPKKNRKSGS